LPPCTLHPRPWSLHDQGETHAIVDFPIVDFLVTLHGSEAGSYLRLIDFVYHSTLGLSVIKKKKKIVTLHPYTYALNPKPQPPGMGIRRGHGGREVAPPC